MGLTTGSRFRLPERLRCDPGPFSRDCLGAFADRTGLREEPGEAWLFLRREALPEEHYALRVEADRVTVSASSEKGVIQGLTELFLRLERGEVPMCDIQDGPRYPHRGLSLDCVRHFFPMEEVEKILEQMALVKMNVLHFHLSDDQGWRIESLRFPELHRQSGDYYTREELRRLVAFAKSRGIDIIPEIDLPGHTTAILAAYPQLGCTGQRPKLATEGGIYNTILCAGREEIFEFVEALLEDMMELFPDPWFHIGGDEAPKYYWERCPHCQARIKAEGLANTRQLQGWFSNRVAAFLRSKGRRTLMWNDGAWGGNVDKEVLMQIWFPDQDSAMDNHVARGGQVMLSPVDVCYCDYPHGAHPLKGVYDMNLQPHGFPRESVVGGEVLTWSEHIRTAEQLQTLAFPRFTALAEVLWMGDHRTSYEDFRERLDALLPVFGEKGIRLLSPEEWDPDPSKREEIIDAFLNQAQTQFEVDYQQLLQEM